MEEGGDGRITFALFFEGDRAPTTLGTTSQCNPPNFHKIFHVDALNAFALLQCSLATIRVYNFSFAPSHVTELTH